MTPQRLIHLTRTSGSLLGVCAMLVGCSTGATTGTTIVSPGPVTGPYAAYTQSYAIPYVGAPSFTNLTTTLKVQAQINGGTLASYTIDTGSVGVVVPASEVPNIPANSPAGSLTYSSSGLKLVGVWATLPVTFPQATNASGSAATASATVPVLAVTSSTCTGVGVNAGSCTGTVPHQLGVGFGRGTDVYSSPLYNAFLNTNEMVAGTMRRGYLLTRTGVSLGLTTADVGSGFVTQTLTTAGTPAAGAHNDWLTPAGSFKIASGATLTGVVLVDTGLLNMIVEDATIPQSGTITNGTALTITLGAQSYSFATGDGGVQTPTSVSYATASHGTFVNTGLRALGHYDLLFDADGGLFGMRSE